MSLLTLRAHGHCCWTLYRKKPLNMLSMVWKYSWSQKVNFEFSNFDKDCTEERSKVQPCAAASHVLTAYKSAPCENFKIELLQYWKTCSCMIILLCRSVVDKSLFIVIKYTRLTPRLIKNKFSQNKISLDSFLGHGPTLLKIK